MRDSRSAEEMRREALSIARKADVIVAAMGESSEFSGECACRTSLDMPDSQHDLLVELKKTGKPIVLLNFSGRPVVLNWESENLPAILQVWFGGSETGDAVADVLFGDYSPSGKLPAAFPRSVGQMPMTYRHYNTGRPLPDGQDTFSKFLSSYIDSPTSPLFPFGYGLSYTTFEYSNISIDNSSSVVNITVRNTGSVDADEVVQMYIRDIVSMPARPVKELRGWQRIHLKAGESKTVEFCINDKTLGFYNADGEWQKPEGEFEIMVGGNSCNVESLKFNVE